MNITQEELNQLKTMLPSVEAEFPTEEQVLKEAELSVPTTQVFIEPTLTLLLKAHEDRIKEKYELIHAHILQGTGKYKTRYTLPSKLLKEKVKTTQEKALKHHREAVEAAKMQALDKLISDTLVAKQKEADNKLKKEQDSLKNELLKKLFN